MTKPLDLDALRADYADTVACLKNERLRAGELLRERDAEIARQKEELQRLCVNPSCCPLIKTVGALIGTVTARDAEIARLEEVSGDAYEKHYQEVSRLRAPPGADVMAIAERLYVGVSEKPYYSLGKTEIARALQQYGDERARDARAAAIEECAQVTAGPWPATRLYQDDTRFLQTKAVAAIRTLAANPWSET